MANAGVTLGPVMTGDPKNLFDIDPANYTKDALTNKYSWLVPYSTWKKLHYIPGVTCETWDEWWEDFTPPPNVGNPKVTAVCGSSFGATLPGFFSRMGLDRCAHCCDALYIPRGCGAALNDNSLDELRKQYA